MNKYYGNVRRLIIVSLRIILYKEQILNLHNQLHILKSLNIDTSPIITIIDNLRFKKEIAKKYVLQSMESILIEQGYVYDIEEFKFLTREDIRKGYIVLNKEFYEFFDFFDGKVKYYDRGERVLKIGNYGTLTKYLKIKWPV